jgi:hypothetical protein
MSLRKSPTMTAARLEANRRNAKKSTGPRTARGKAQVRFNALKSGGRSRHYQNLRMTFYYARPGAVLGPYSFLTPEMARHPLFANAEQYAIEAEIATCMLYSPVDRRTTQPRGKRFFNSQSQNVTDNKEL